MILYESKYVEIIYEKENSLIIDKFLPETANMNMEEFKKEMIIFAEMCEKYKPERELVHLLNMNFIIEPDMQNWMNTEIFPRYENIIKRMAFLVPVEIFSQISVEQTMDQGIGRKFTQQYFKTEEEARKWLIVDELKDVTQLM